MVKWTIKTWQTDVNLKNISNNQMEFKVSVR